MMYKLKVTWQEFSLIMQAVGFFFAALNKRMVLFPILLRGKTCLCSSLSAKHKDFPVHHC